MDRQFKVVRMIGLDSSATMVKATGKSVEVNIESAEAEELARVNAELVEVNCITENEIIEAAKDAIKAAGCDMDEIDLIAADQTATDT